ncbi:MAG: hypothetical protein IM638_09050 [Bacteroidetes bacterium]|nr:hypothetical protein [Bacteroidota bacterium]
MITILLLISGISFCARLHAAQTEDSCRTITVKRPETAARFKGDIGNYLNTNTDSTLLPGKNCMAIVQLQLNCSGTVVKVIFDRSTLPPALQQHIYDLILHSTAWKPAQHEGLYVWTVISLSIQASSTQITARTI